MIKNLTTCALRPLLEADAAPLAVLANNEKIARNLRDRFPHPYTEEDARRFIGAKLHEKPHTVFAIEVDGGPVGVIGVEVRDDVERLSGEIGYWIGEPFWGRGIASEVIPAVVDYAFGELDLVRVYALVFDYNRASARVLEKSGFVREGILRRSGIKHGRIVDRRLYARLRRERVTKPERGPAAETNHRRAASPLPANG